MKEEIIIVLLSHMINLSNPTRNIVAIAMMVILGLILVQPTSSISETVVNQLDSTQISPQATNTTENEGSEPNPFVLTEQLLTPLPTPISEPAIAIPVTYIHGPTNFPQGVNPLTGLPVNNPALLERRPIAIKICNFPRSVRPQWGLTLADHVYEYYIGDNMTRFIGVFYGNDAYRAGPVRSARLFDEHVMRMYKAYFVFGYADVRVREELFDTDLKPLLIIETPTNCPPICRYDNGLAYNNLFADTAGLTSYLKHWRGNNTRQSLEGMLFDFNIPMGGQGGEKFGIYFTYLSYHRWEYDSKLGRYLRYQETESDHGNGLKYAPLTDDLTGQQISASNIVVIRVPHEVFYESSSTLILDQPLTNKGTGYVFRDGRIYPVVWMHKARDQLLTLTSPDGDLFPFKPGNVWFEVIGRNSQLEFHSDGNWFLTSTIP